MNSSKDKDPLSKSQENLKQAQINYHDALDDLNSSFLLFSKELSNIDEINSINNVINEIHEEINNHRLKLADRLNDTRKDIERLRVKLHNSNNAIENREMLSSQEVYLVDTLTQIIEEKSEIAISKSRLFKKDFRH